MNEYEMIKLHYKEFKEFIKISTGVWDVKDIEHVITFEECKYYIGLKTSIWARVYKFFNSFLVAIDDETEFLNFKR